MTDTVFISGGSGPVGRAIADAFAADGITPVLFQRTVQDGPDHPQVQLDVTGEDVAGVIAGAVSSWGTPRHVVVAAGIAQNAPTMLMSEAAFAEVVSVNLVGAFRFVKPLLRPMMSARAGTVTFVSSVSALTGSAGQGNYAASKAGLSGLMKSIAQEMGPYGVRANSVLGGLLDEGIADEMPAPAREAITARTPLRALGSAGDIAQCVRWLSSDAARHVTGAEIPVTGGYEIG